MPTRGVIGTDYLKVRPDFKVLRNPYGDDDVVVVPAVNPEIAIFHAFRADREGNVIADRNQNNWILAQAAERVIVTVEEIVEPGDLVRESFDALVSNIHIDAIVHTPRGAHPTPCRGYYRTDGAHIREYLRYAASDASFQEYLDRYVRVGEARYQEMVGTLVEEGSKG